MEKKGATSEEGFVSLEVIFFTGFILVLFAIIVGVLLYIYPTFILQRNISVLTREIEHQGCLNDRSLNRFKNEVSRYGFVDKTKGGITVNTKNEVLNEDGYVERGGVIIVEIVVPTKNKVMDKFTGKKNDYVFSFPVISEKL